VVYAVNYVSAHHVEEVEVHGDQDQNYWVYQKNPHTVRGPAEP
jgi:hypothetical protein